jgi:hypothetical protein
MTFGHFRPLGVTVLTFAASRDGKVATKLGAVSEVSSGR